MTYHPRHQNPIIALHGPGPDGTLCRHCDHIDSDLVGKEKSRFFCKVVSGTIAHPNSNDDTGSLEEEGLGGEGRPFLQGSAIQSIPSLQDYIPAIHEIAKQNPKLYLANYQKYNHRITWPSCSLFSGEAVITYLCKGPCEKEYTIARTGHDSRRFTGYCQSCAEITHREKRELERERAEKMLPKCELEECLEGRKVMKVCFPVKAKEGTKRKKCLGNSIAEECQSYKACRDYACMMSWNGFRDCGEEGVEAKKRGASTT